MRRKTEHRLRWGLCAAVLVPLTVAWTGAWSTPAQAQPAAADVKEAAASFDLGAKAFEQKRYEEAASHFEAADMAVPAPEALRLAIRSRLEAGQGDRAASLAALAKRRHPDHASLTEMADEALDAHRADLHQVDITCELSCVLAVDNRIVHGQASTGWTVFLEPGSRRISASFEEESADPQDVDAVAGGQTELRFDVPAEAPPPVVAPVPKPTPSPQPEKKDPVEPPKGDTDEAWGLHPAFFIAGMVATAGVGGVTVWSGVDTLNNPGEDTVRDACRGQGTDCPEYQQGVDAQNRTNILIGATGGAAAITLVLFILTDWGGSEETAVRPFVTVGGHDQPSGLGLSGAF